MADTNWLAPSWLVPSLAYTAKRRRRDGDTSLAHRNGAHELLVEHRESIKQTLRKFPGTLMEHANCALRNVPISGSACSPMQIHGDCNADANAASE